MSNGGNQQKKGGQQPTLRKQKSWRTQATGPQFAAANGQQKPQKLQPDRHGQTYDNFGGSRDAPDRAGTVIRRSIKPSNVKEQRVTMGTFKPDGSRETWPEGHIYCYWDVVRLVERPGDPGKYWVPTLDEGVHDPYKVFKHNAGVTMRQEFRCAFKCFDTADYEKPTIAANATKAWVNTKLRDAGWRVDFQKIYCMQPCTIWRKWVVRVDDPEGEKTEWAPDEAHGPSVNRIPPPAPPEEKE